ncbi:MAG: transcription antitermination factor NusB [Alphaproteobacteria bacterium]
MTETDKTESSKPAEPAATADGGARPAANQRGAARLAAVQALYQLDVGGQTLDSVVEEFKAHRIGQEIEGEQLRPADADFFRSVLAGVVDRQLQIDPLIHKALPDSWPLKRIDITLRAVLRCGVFELVGRADVPAAVVITEYVEIAKAFFDTEEPGLVNGVLDRIARDVRSKEISQRRGTR